MITIKGYKINFSNATNYLLFGGIEKVFSYRMLNLWKTLYINFRLFPFRQAIKFPIFVYGRLKVKSLIGSATIKSNITTGMITFGSSSREEFVAPAKSFVNIQGQIIFNGSAIFFNGFQIIVYRDKILNIGENVFLNANVTIFAIDHISIGNNVRIAYRTIIMSGDMHYSINTNYRSVSRNLAPISIGNNNWITGDVTIQKGTVTPDWTIVTNGTLLNRDYTKEIPEGSIIGGSPVKLIKENQRRVFSLKSEFELTKFFSEQTDYKTKYILDAEVGIDDFCVR